MPASVWPMWTGERGGGPLAGWRRGFHGSMDYTANHGLRRARPAELVPGTVRVITARMDDLPAATPIDRRERELQRLTQPGEAVSAGCPGRDYHKVVRARLQKLSHQIAALVGCSALACSPDSAPAPEADGQPQRAGLARQAHAGAEP